ncbi:MAG TPA: tyrosine-type recombinase/integrase [Alphaproteobacteria bacterium]|nr:tyrosine-type recombinase/integrase [Alphaproteobacteria bacterium]
MSARAFIALREAGIAGIAFHGLRQTFATHPVMAGVDLMIVNEFFGHKDLKVTMRYTGLALGYNWAAIARLAPYMDTGQKKGVTAHAVTP